VFYIIHFQVSAHQWKYFIIQSISVNIC